MNIKGIFGGNNNGMNFGQMTGLITTLLQFGGRIMTDDKNEQRRAILELIGKFATNENIAIANNFLQKAWFDIQAKDNCKYILNLQSNHDYTDIMLQVYRQVADEHGVLGEAVLHVQIPLSSITQEKITEFINTMFNGSAAVAEIG